MKLVDLIRPFRRVDTPPPNTLWPFIWWCLSGSWPALTIAAIACMLAGSLEVVTAYLLGAVLDATSGTAEGFWQDQWPLAVVFIVFYIVLRPIIFGVSALSNSIIVQPNVGPQILSRLHRWTMGHSVRFFDEDFAGRLTQKQMQVSNSVTELTSEFLNTICFAIASVVGALILVLGVDIWMAVGLLAWFVAYVLMISWFIPRVRLRAKARANARAAITGQVVDTFTNIRTVKLFAHDDFEDAVALDAMNEFRNRAVEFGRVAVAFRLALMTIAGVVPIMLIGGTVYMWTLGSATAGDIAATGAIALRLSHMTGWVSFTLMGMYGHLGEAEDGMKTLTPAHDLTDDIDAAELVVPRGEINFDDVTFAYGERNGGVRDIALTIQPSQKVGIVGASGAGKSTLVSLLLRLYDTEQGRVLIDGQNISNVTQVSLRRHIGMVTQDTSMFNRSAMDNIRYGRPDATDAEVMEAARKAEAHTFIPDLRDAKGRTGYDAFLGERGVKLSGGQRQRIAIARTILKDAPILVLDEATSALDSEVEAAIQESLDQVMEGKTVLAIAHRLSTIARMDRIIVMEGGRIVEDGTHDDLLAQGGIYARYWARQSGGFIGTDD
ncbi:ABC transporter ATP-binding protein [Marivivens donghaensis]|uniref:ABC transporter ATP-binding protein n=1 Tax=Marivivens donghaensis TaxID=1699413 RepID=A0ABX0VU02_9RHOB|nr:ABC transporter ATP-binding protein [Marivivens donghaensis]NIY71465.1 ABC transporter ATP-binding protein [Marivivens donghaensis]